VGERVLDLRGREGIGCGDVVSGQKKNSQGWYGSAHNKD